LRARIEHRRKTDIDRYAAGSPPEFFAVVSEAFFEKPLTLQRKHPELYHEFVGYYRLDPAALMSGKPG
ncbi:MAG TPA: zinc-dependent peptidase, partial [Polyangiaceae bacterium]|nr:zinc-dependent peptidase [Polyangiaceae bacterium]